MSANGASKVDEPLDLVPEEPDQSNGTTSKSRFDPKFTDTVIRATGPKANKRVAQIMPGLIRHMHDFLRENEITVDEWFAALELLNECGRMSNDRRNEMQLFLDIVGVETLVDEITYKLASEAPDEATASAILGPFWRKDAPKYKHDDSIVLNGETRGLTYMHGRITDISTGEPIENVEVDVWHTSPNGLYEQQDPDQPDMNLRGRFFTDKDGRFSFYCLKPVPYPIPTDGPSNVLLQLLDRHPMRPAHIHFMITGHGYKPLVTQVFDREGKYIEDDSVFAVKDSLMVDFKPVKDNPKAQFDLEYDFKLVKYADKEGAKKATESAPSVPVS